MEKVLEVNNLSIILKQDTNNFTLIKDISFNLMKGETLALVGESGCGKTLTCKSIMGILPPNIEVSCGDILLEDINLSNISEATWEKVRGKKITMLFQNSGNSLNPTMTIGKQIMEGVLLHQQLSKEKAFLKTIDLLNLVGIPSPEERFNHYPHQFSGGMVQRIAIAIALSCNPRILIADEPTTALDVTIQAQILDLLKEIQLKTGVSIIFITHDLGVVANIATRVAVMYAGKIVEMGTCEDIFYNAKHPYTWGLLGSIPSLHTHRISLYTIPGSAMDITSTFIGDAFAYRNAYSLKIDFLKDSPMFKISDTHFAATWLLHPLAPSAEDF